MQRRTRRERTQKEIKLEITPLIDVVFLILVFFMCTLEFKDQRKLFETWLPRDLGLGEKDQEQPRPIPEIVLRVPAADRSLPPSQRRVVFVMGATNRTFGQAVIKPSDEAKPDLEFSPADTRSRIVSYLAGIRAADPTMTEVKIRCDPRVPHAFTAALIGFTRAADYTRIKCSGIPQIMVEALAKGDL